MILVNLKIRKMKKEQYLKELEGLKEVIKNAEKAKTELRDKYIEANKPFEKGTNVRIILDSGRVVTGEVHGYGILHGGGVYVTAYKTDKNKLAYVSIPYKSIEKM